MRAMVMAAGRGTRLAPLTDSLPKPAIPVANEPVMAHLLRLLARHGVRDVVSNISYKADEMRMVFGDGTPWGINLTWSYEPELLGNAGGVRNVEEFLVDGDEPIVILSGDGVHDADINELARRHRAAGAVVTIGLSRVADPSEYGVAILDDEGFITRFQEKPPLGEELSDLANTGIYILSPRAFELMPPRGEFCDFGMDFFPALLEAGERMLGVEIDGYWNDIGGLEAFRDGNLAAVDGRLPGLAVEVESDGRFGDDVLVHPTARISDDVTIIGPSIVGAGALIASGARINRSVVLPGSIVPSNALLAAATFGSANGLRTWARSLGEHEAVAPTG